jgi:hypothetical protein
VHNRRKQRKNIFAIPVPANADDVNDTITITIDNDKLPENAEYLIVRFTNPVNITLPPSASNHYTVLITDDDRRRTNCISIHKA